MAGAFAWRTVAPGLTGRVRALPAALLVGVLAAPATAQTFSGSTDVPVPGGTAGVAAVLGMRAPPRAIFIPELVRHIYGAPEGKNEEADRLLHLLADYIADVGRLQTALAAVQPANGSVSLSLANDQNGRKRLQALLEVIGLRLRGQNRQ